MCQTSDKPSASLLEPALGIRDRGHGNVCVKSSDKPSASLLEPALGIRDRGHGNVCVNMSVPNV